MYEVFLTRKVTEAKTWGEFLDRLVHLHRIAEKLEVVISFDGAAVRFFVKSARELPHFLTDMDGFTLVRTEDFDLAHQELPSLVNLIVRKGENILSLKERLAIKDLTLTKITLVARRTLSGYYLKFYASIDDGGMLKTWRLSAATLEILNLDFRKSFVLGKMPKYLNAAKTLPLFTSESQGAVLKLEQFPYFRTEHYLTLKNIDFYKHTAVFGASGAGKSKFLAKMICEVMEKYGDKYHFLVIDPHDAMRDEIGGMDGVKVLDFADSEHGLDLFVTSSENIINNVEMTVGLMRSLAATWNPLAERLARAAVYVLIEKGELSLQNFRRLITDMQYKNAVIQSVSDYLPESLQEFFGQDYNELRTQHYDETFALLVGLMDELQFTPAIYRQNTRRLEYELATNQTTLLSLNIAKHGEKAVKTLAGLAMNQLFALGMKRNMNQHIILVVDEVAVVEHPVLTRFLSEARKYNISVVLAGQYFAQVTDKLKTAIYANVSNYFCFRLNYDDAKQLVEYLDIEIANNSQAEFPDVRLATFQNDSDSERERMRLLTTLPDRWTLARISRCGMLMPAVMGRSLDFKGVTDKVRHVKKPAEQPAKMQVQMQKKPLFEISGSSVFDLMREQSTSRKKLS